MKHQQKLNEDVHSALATMEILPISSKSKIIKKDKLDSFSGVNQFSGRRVMIMNITPNKSSKTSTNTITKTQAPSYLKGGQSESTMKNLKLRYNALLKRVAPTDLDFEQNKIYESHSKTL